MVNDADVNDDDDDVDDNVDYDLIHLHELKILAQSM